MKKITKERLEQLSKKWLDKTITEEEMWEFESWYASFDDFSFDEFSEEEAEELGQRMFKRLSSLSIDPPIQKSRIVHWRANIFKYVAAVLLLTFSLYWYYDNFYNRIAPGGNKLFVYSPSGTKYNLTDVGVGEQFKLGTSSFKKLDSTTLMMQPLVSTLEPVEYTTIITPRGGEYKVMLTDGTIVWLNADSKIEIPSRFDDSIRHVRLRGEAFFEVAHKAQSRFVVETDYEKITVFGTKFNVLAYANIRQSQTSLTEGSVEVKSTISADKVMLKPGYRSLNSGRGVSVATFDPDEVLAWKNGEFMFNGLELQEALHRLSRWYDVDFVFESNNKKQKLVWGTLSKFEEFKDALLVLEGANIAKFKVEGRRVIVK
ncbi:FecR domain-containing protein [Sphingobacterium sp. UT-1RO-CII-1]|uniref:FecR family protein n=1 Tax=Sphingobacterium sp. UT-1RO-CII-1 TaxID=2995225 RepID=UPI00227C3D8F|nr:FecR family protein [Sphingobacterium sp. UT-1RO-CII-1]MCY4780610.1 FecR domain-containing protein [Sphingobacterium sp. UT-1RO-CII-1]